MKFSMTGQEKFTFIIFTGDSCA